MTVHPTPLHDAVLDTTALDAGKAALMVELVAEWFGKPTAHVDRRPDRDEELTARALELAARRARRIADRERMRCAGLGLSEREEATP